MMYEVLVKQVVTFRDYVEADSKERAKEIAGEKFCDELEEVNVDCYVADAKEVDIKERAVGIVKKAKDIAFDYIKNHINDEKDYWVLPTVMIRIRQSYDIEYGYCVELYEYSENHDGLVDALTETKETLKNGIEYLLALV